MTGDEHVGSVGEEAAKLLGALQEWARENGSDYANAAAAAAAGATTASALNEHIATGGKDCRFCPICQVIYAVRAISPEVKQHLTTAATSLLKAAAEAMAAAEPRSGREPGVGVEKIDLADEGAWGDE